MGDSSACLMGQPFCYASGFSKEANKGNPIHPLGQSVSFGRFMSESLAWEKWSTFSHNRYVEEAERFTRPGSVAQKKAFFEAHYKKLAAQREAALLEQANSASQTQQQHEAVVDNINTQNSQMKSPKSKLVEENADSNRETSLTESNKVDGAKLETDHQAFVVKLQNQFEDVDNHMELSEKHGSNFDEEVLQSRDNKKPLVSAFKLLKVIGSTKFNSTPVKSTAPILSNGDDIATPMSNKPELSSNDKERSTARSLHKSLNFTLIKEFNRLTSSVMKKFESSRVGASSSKASENRSSPPRTTTKASKKELQKHSSFTPLTEAKRNKRTEERASSRKKKLDKNFNASEAQKVHLHTKFKEKAEIKIRKLRRGFCFKARSPPDFYKGNEASNRETIKDLLTLPESPKQGRPTLSVIESRKSSLPPPRSPFKGKNCGTFTKPLTSNSPVIITRENTSPNIQHGNQNDRECS